MTKIVVEDLTQFHKSSTPVEWINEFMAQRKLLRSDLNVLSVSAQVLVTELFEEVELLSNQATSIAIPNVKDALIKLERDLDAVKAEEHSQLPATLESSKLAFLLQEAADLQRARSNIRSVRDRIDSIFPKMKIQN